MKRFAMKRSISTVLIAIYGLALLFLALGAMALAVSNNNGKVSNVMFGLPAWTPQTLMVTVMALIALRLWMHLRARKAASASGMPKTENEND